MSYIETIILDCLKQLNGERTIYSIYHLFKGKKSSQTIQDAHLFALTAYFGVYPQITREDVEGVIRHALLQKRLVSCGEQRFLLTKAGEDVLQQSKSRYKELRYLNGWKYHQKDWQLWKRLSLLVQVISNLVHHESHYLPIQKEKHLHYWLKAFLTKLHISRNALGITLYSELVDCLEAAVDLNPLVFTLRLTGYNKIGLTANQAAEKLQMELPRYELEFLNILHYLLEQIALSPNRFPLLGSIFKGQEHDRTLTLSAQKTFELLQRGYSLEEVSKQRRLKRSTIEDHIVEIALNIDGFSIDSYVEKQRQLAILAAARQSDSKRLKEIRSKAHDADYFEIRLVLAKYGVKQWN